MTIAPKMVAWAPRAKAPKYRNRKVAVAGMKFDSAAESRRYQVLSLLQAAGEISDLRRQVPYVLVPKLRRADGTPEREVAYVADFVYTRDGQAVVEDVKSAPTRALPAYIIKRKLMLHVHGVTILETK